MKTGRPKSKKQRKTVTLRMSYNTDQYIEILRKGAIRASGVMSTRTYTRSDILEQCIDSYFLKKQYEGRFPDECGSCYGSGLTAAAYLQKKLESKAPGSNQKGLNSTESKALYGQETKNNPKKGKKEL